MERRRGMEKEARMKATGGTEKDAAGGKEGE